MGSFERDTQSRREEFSRQQKRISKSQKKDKATIGSAVKKFVTAANMSTDAIKECMTEEEYNLFHSALLDPGQTFALKRTSTRQSTRESSANSEADITKSRVRSASVVEDGAQGEHQERKVDYGAKDAFKRD